MRAVVQRVAEASVTVGGERVAAIGPGILVLLGVTHEDGPAEADRLADKVRALRIFPDADGRMNEPLGDREALVVSQFTLYGDARRGTRPRLEDQAAATLEAGSAATTSTSAAMAIGRVAGRWWRASRKSPPPTPASPATAPAR